MGEKMSENFYIIGTGHGRPTPGKRCPKDENGNVLMREYDIVRQIALKLASGLDLYNIDFELMNASCDVDISLKSRVQYVDYLHAKYKNVVYIPLHINAKGMGRRWFNDVGGVRIHHYGKATAGMAQCFAESFHVNTQFDDAYELRHGYFRSVISRHLYELRKPKCKVILPEMGFQTCRSDVDYLLDGGGMDDSAGALCHGIRRIELL